MTDTVNPQAWAAFWTCLVIALASSSISITITQTELFAPLRAWATKVHPMVGHLMHCFYCTSHWAVIAGILIYQPVLVSSGHHAADLIVSAFFTITVATLTSGMIFSVFLAAMAKAMKERVLKRMLSEDA
ncbi:DUF1360 domain-containing protein [Azospirillum formosense]|uniref:DUF1360 domain-containing protein n=1 Tax=Azospirillum formosense TaxID=861533 RepID=A0ABX2KYP1_9PROT|nr:DUF1360 domain-containing protein [Azospirillum formosense]MBY3756359.1 DUF1360 domain-containing protein [Azospirillum formosense]NUB21788.1 DUF1360 domain-containing protein [Azospirillum formosense]